MVRRIAFLMLGCLLATYGWLWAAPQFKRVERNTGASPAVASTVMPVSEEQVRAALDHTCETGGALITSAPDTSGLTDVLRHFRLYGPDHLPSEFQMRARAGNDTAMQRYLEMAPALRQNDYYLSEPRGNYFWPSEYYYQAQPAPFRCSFIIHLEATGQMGTRLETFEYLPIVRVGKRFHLLGQRGPGFYDDIRMVEPTVKEREVVLRVLTTMAASSAGAR